MIITTFVAAIVLALPQREGMEERKNSQPTAQVVAKGKDYMIHAVPSPIGSPFNALIQGPTLLHTKISTGEMKVLARTHTSVSIMPMGIDRVHYHATEVIAHVMDKERLYVLRSVVESTQLGHAWSPTREPRRFALLVFRVEDGQLVHTLPLKTPDPKVIPKEPLRLREKGVEVFGARFEFEGMELIRPAPQNKKQK